jgi:hypothetical protein
MESSSFSSATHFINQIDRLVRKTVADVTMGQDCSRHDRGVSDTDTMMNL